MVHQIRADAGKVSRRHRSRAPEGVAPVQCRSAAAMPASGWRRRRGWSRRRSRPSDAPSRFSRTPIARVPSNRMCSTARVAKMRRLGRRRTSGVRYPIAAETRAARQVAHRRWEDAVAELGIGVVNFRMAARRHRLRHCRAEGRPTLARVAADRHRAVRRRAAGRRNRGRARAA